MSEEYVTRAEYNKDIKRIDIKNENQDKDIKKLSEEVAELKSVWKILIEVPTKMERIREEQIKISSTFSQIFDKLDTLANEMKSQKSELEEGFEEKLKSINGNVAENTEDIKKNNKKWNIALDEFIVKNWFAIIVAVVTLYMAIADKFF